MAAHFSFNFLCEVWNDALEGGPCRRVDIEPRTCARSRYVPFDGFCCLCVLIGTHEHRKQCFVLLSVQSFVLSYLPLRLANVHCNVSLCEVCTMASHSDVEVLNRCFEFSCRELGCEASILRRGANDAEILRAEDSGSV
jgi:hypothetical protein